jgi:hypothetical protein
MVHLNRAKDRMRNERRKTVVGMFERNLKYVIAHRAGAECRRLV